MPLNPRPLPGPMSTNPANHSNVARIQPSVGRAGWRPDGSEELQKLRVLAVETELFLSDLEHFGAPRRVREQLRKLALLLLECRILRDKHDPMIADIERQMELAFQKGEDFPPVDIDGFADVDSNSPR